MFSFRQLFRVNSTKFCGTMRQFLSILLVGFLATTPLYCLPQQSNVDPVGVQTVPGTGRAGAGATAHSGAGSVPGVPGVGRVGVGEKPVEGTSGDNQGTGRVGHAETPEDENVVPSGSDTQGTGRVGHAVGQNTGGHVPPVVAGNAGSDRSDYLHVNVPRAKRVPEPQLVIAGDPSQTTGTNANQDHEVKKHQQHSNDGDAGRVTAVNNGTEGGHGFAGKGARAKRGLGDYVAFREKRQMDGHGQGLSNTSSIGVEISRGVGTGPGKDNATAAVTGTHGDPGSIGTRSHRDLSSKAGGAHGGVGSMASPTHGLPGSMGIESQATRGSISGSQGGAENSRTESLGGSGNTGAGNAGTGPQGGSQETGMGTHGESTNRGVGKQGSMTSDTQSGQSSTDAQTKNTVPGDTASAGGRSARSPDQHSETPKGGVIASGVGNKEGASKGVSGDAGKGAHGAAATPDTGKQGSETADSSASPKGTENSRGIGNAGTGSQGGSQDTRMGLHGGSISAGTGRQASMTADSQSGQSSPDSQSANVGKATVLGNTGSLGGRTARSPQDHETEAGTSEDATHENLRGRQSEDGSKMQDGAGEGAIGNDSRSVRQVAEVYGQESVYTGKNVTESETGKEDSMDPREGGADWIGSGAADAAIKQAQ